MPTVARPRRRAYAAIGRCVRIAYRLFEKVVDTHCVQDE